MSISGNSLVRGGGGRAVGLAVTGVGLYIVAPSLLTMFGAWPRLSEVDEPWFAILAALEACSLACLWWLARIALASPDDPVPDGAADGRARRPPRLGWGTPRLPSSLATPPARSSRGVPPPVDRPGQGPHPVRAASRCGGVGAHGHQPAGDSGALAPARAHHPGPDHRAAGRRSNSLGLLVSLILAAVIVAIGVTALTWPSSWPRPAWSPDV